MSGDLKRTNEYEFEFEPLQEASKTIDEERKIAVSWDDGA
jgi:hypothetical protein